MALNVTWVEIPCKDIQRALKFYEAVFGVTAEITDDGERKTATLFYAPGGVGVSLNQTANFEPSDKGIYVYLDAGDAIDTVLPKVAPAGGKALTDKISMGEAGFYATILDTEGNAIGLYCAK
jgi:uncharacterized protein